MVKPFLLRVKKETKKRNKKYSRWLKPKGEFLIRVTERSYLRAWLDPGFGSLRCAFLLLLPLCPVSACPLSPPPRRPQSITGLDGVTMAIGKQRSDGPGLSHRPTPGIRSEVSSLRIITAEGKENGGLLGVR